MKKFENGISKISFYIMSLKFQRFYDEDYRPPLTL